MVKSPWLWIALLAVAACTYTIDDALCLRDDHCDDDEVCGVNRACIACMGEACPPSERCSTDEQCDEDEVCADDKVCRTRCVLDAQCPKSGQCNAPACAAAFGEPCTDEWPDTTDCVDRCVDTNNLLEPVPAYCSSGCYSDPCPAGYECIDSECHVIADTGPVCQHPDGSAICGACVWDNCATDLSTCCQGQLCTDALDQIDLCDATRTAGNCDVLSDPFRFAPTSRELIDCVALHCRNGLCISE